MLRRFPPRSSHSAKIYFTLRLPRNQLCSTFARPFQPFDPLMNCGLTRVSKWQIKWQWWWYGGIQLTREKNKLTPWLLWALNGRLSKFTFQILCRWRLWVLNSFQSAQTIVAKFTCIRCKFLTLIQEIWRRIVYWPNCLELYHTLLDYQACFKVKLKVTVQFLAPTIQYKIWLSKQYWFHVVQLNVSVTSTYFLTKFRCSQCKSRFNSHCMLPYNYEIYSKRVKTREY